MLTFNQFIIEQQVEEDLSSFLNPKVAHWIDRKIRGKRYKLAVRAFLDAWSKDKKHKLFGGYRLALA